VKGSRTPFRISFFGGGTDLPEFYKKYQGRVLCTSINKYMYLFAHKFFDERIQIKYSKTELVSKANEIKHPIAREVLKNFKLKGIDINSIADIPAGTGLGSSSSYTVGLIHVLDSYLDKKTNKNDLAERASNIEVNILKEPIGKQDQYAASFGGLNQFSFDKDGSVNIEAIDLKKETLKELQNNLLMFYTGKNRVASSILNDQKDRTLNDAFTFDVLCKMSDLVVHGKNALLSSSLKEFGLLLDETWKLKKLLSKSISSPFLDSLYDEGIQAGALGGKILGAGGGGFILFYAEPKFQKPLRKAMSKLKEIDFIFDFEGSKIIDINQ
tara:strand:- start:1684 stop:2661 length:978 start_codon:yes stop_codon:yes gene_type:complete